MLMTMVMMMGGLDDDGFGVSHYVVDYGVLGQCLVCLVFWCLDRIRLEQAYRYRLSHGGYWSLISWLL